MKSIWLYIQFLFCANDIHFNNPSPTIYLSLDFTYALNGPEMVHLSNCFNRTAQRFKHRKMFRPFHSNFGTCLGSTTVSPIKFGWQQNEIFIKFELGRNKKGTSNMGPWNTSPCILIINMETFPLLLVLFMEIHWSAVDSPNKGYVMWS